VASEYKVEHVIVCDDVRREDNGKELLIGVYNHAIIVAEDPPYTLMKLCFRILVDLRSTGKKKMVFVINTPSGRDFLSAEGTVEAERAEKTSLILPIFPARLPELGIYTIKFALDGKPRKIGEFEVRRKAPEGEHN
jgi:hypothetical protein